MSLTDDVVAQFLDFANFLDINPVQIAEAAESAEDPTELIAVIVNTVDPTGEAADVIIDQAEEFILTPIEETGEITPENVEGLQDELEGNAGGVIFSFIALTLAVEAGSVGQVDEVPSEILQAVAAIGFEDVTGREIDARLQEGIDPALKQKVHRESRSKQADFQDFVEGNLALRKSDSQIGTLDGIDAGDLPDYLNPDDLGWLADPDTYGTVPAQTSLFELAALNVSEPEELIEEPIQYGIPVPESVIQQATAINGTPKDAESVYKQVIDQMPKTENLLRDYVRLTEFLFRLREKVESGAINALQATQLVDGELRDLLTEALPPEDRRQSDRSVEEVTDILIEELFRNFRLLESLPPDPPSQTQMEAWYRKGVIESQQFADLYDRFGERSEDLDKYLAEEAIDQGWEDIQRQVALGRISETEGQFRLRLIGFSNQEAAQILRGADGDSLVAQRLQQRGDTDELSPEIAQEIGPVRASQLRVVGITSLQDIVNAGVERLVNVTGMSDTEAQQAIESAELFIEQQANRE
jgi:hypothetical protein